MFPFDSTENMLWFSASQMQLAASKGLLVNVIYAHSIKVNRYLLSDTIHKTECYSNLVTQSPPHYPKDLQTFAGSEFHTQRTHFSRGAFLVYVATPAAIMDRLDYTKHPKQKILAS